jgi:pyruvate, orthophosphate dikinase
VCGSGVGVLQDPQTQLEMAIAAVFGSWYNPRAIRYRSYNNIPENMGTGVTVQVRQETGPLLMFEER